MPRDDIDMEVPPAPCPYCGKVLDATTPISGNGRPESGSWSICAYCTGVSRFDGASLRAVLPEDLEAAPEELHAARQIVRREGPAGRRPRVLVDIGWAEDGEGGRGLLVRDHGGGPTDVGVAAIAMCMALERLPMLGPETHEAARALRLALTGGREVNVPVEVYWRSPGDRVGQARADKARGKID